MLYLIYTYQKKKKKFALRYICIITIFNLVPHFNRASAFLSPHALVIQGLGAIGSPFTFDYLGLSFSFYSICFLQFYKSYVLIPKSYPFCFLNTSPVFRVRCPTSVLVLKQP